MKKKLYNTPQTIIVKIKTANILYVSSANMSTAVEDRINNSDDFGSRRQRSVWDDDEDDDN